MRAGILLGATQVLLGCTPVLSFVVDTVTDSADVVAGDGVCDDGTGACSLRAAVQEANASPGFDEIVLSAGETYPLTITGSGEEAGATGDLDITEGLRITGQGATIDASALGDRVIDSATGGILYLEDVTVTGGTADSGGGVRSKDGGLLAMHLTVEGNTATQGAGGIDGTAGDFTTVFDTTISGNTGGDAGGVSASTFAAANTTISDNTASAGVGGLRTTGASKISYSTVTANAGGGAANIGGTLELQASLVGDQASGPDCSGTMTSLGYNVDSDSSCGLGATGDQSGTPLMLGALTENGGKSRTRIPQPGSPALNRVPTGTDCPIFPTDQRLATRPKTGACESGAVEVETAIPGDYTLYSDMRNDDIFVRDLEGDIVNRWDAGTTNLFSPYMLPGGRIVRAAATGSGFCVPICKLEILAWDGTVEWTFEAADYHHDLAVMPNGNFLILAYDRLTMAEAVALGRDPTLADEGLDKWPDPGITMVDIFEVDPTSPSDPIVWQWRSRDHTVQHFDPLLPNYSPLSDHPELLDINHDNIDPWAHEGDWDHANGIDYNPEHDQIVVSSRSFSEVWVIDHSTSSEEAATHTGGAQGMGGDILYRWGNPERYGRGDAGDRQLFFQHDPTWIPTSAPGGYHLMVFNNGPHPDGDYSTVTEFAVPVAADGSYPPLGPGLAHGPANPSWTWSASPPTDLHSVIISGAQRLDDGNTLITAGVYARIFEVTSTGEEVLRWDEPGDLIFKSRRYSDFDGTVPVPVPLGP